MYLSIVFRTNNEVNIFDIEPEIVKDEIHFIDDDALRVIHHELADLKEEIEDLDEEFKDILFGNLEEISENIFLHLKLLIKIHDCSKLKMINEARFISMKKQNY